MQDDEGGDLVRNVVILPFQADGFVHIERGHVCPAGPTPHARPTLALHPQSYAALVGPVE